MPPTSTTFRRSIRRAIVTSAPRSRRAYLSHLFRSNEMLGPRLLSYHNFYLLNDLLREARAAIAAGAWTNYRNRVLTRPNRGITEREYLYMSKILFVVTSHAEIDAEHKTGLWLDEYATPYAALRSAGFEIVTASPRGGKAPLDPRSAEDAGEHTADAMAALAQTHPLHEVGDALEYEAIFIPGGHGTMFDLATSLPVKTLLSEFDAQGKYIASVCHGPAAFVDAIRAGEPRTGFRQNDHVLHRRRGARDRSRTADAVSARSKLREQGANVVEGATWADHVEIDGSWITGQNPQSSASVARALIAALGR